MAAVDSELSALVHDYLFKFDKSLANLYKKKTNPVSEFYVFPNCVLVN